MSDFSIPFSFENITEIRYEERAFDHFHLLLAHDYSKRCLNIKIPFFMISNPDLSLLFPVITGTIWYGKYRFPNIFSPVISKYRLENLHFLFTGKYYSPSLCDYFRHIKLSTQSSNMFQLCLCAKVSAKVEVIGQCFFIVISFVFVKLFFSLCSLYLLFKIKMVP